MDYKRLATNRLVYAAFAGAAGSSIKIKDPLTIRTLFPGAHPDKSHTCSYNPSRGEGVVTLHEYFESGHNGDYFSEQTHTLMYGELPEDSKNLVKKAIYAVCVEKATKIEVERREAERKQRVEVILEELFSPDRL